MIIYVFHTIHVFKVMHFLFFYFYFYFTFLTREIFFLRPVVECTFLEGKQNVSAGIDTLMSISDGLEPSIFCRRMEKARPMGKRWIEMLFISRQSLHFHFDVLI